MSDPRSVASADPHDPVARAQRELPEEFAAAVAARLDREVLVRTRWVALTSGGAGAVFAASMIGRVVEPWLWLWLGALLGLCLGRAAFAHRVLSSDALPPRRVLMVTTVAAALAGAVWGSAAWLPLAAPDPVITFYAAAVVAGIVSGTAVSYASAPRIALAITLPAVPPTALALALRGDGPGYGAALLLLTLAVMVVREARSNRRAVESDIAHRLLLEREKARVQGRETLLRLSADALPQRIAYVDREHRFLFVNRRYVEQLAMSRDKIIGRHLREVLGAQYQMLAEPLAAALAGTPQELELSHQPRLPRGSVQRVSLVPDAREDGGVRGVFVAITEVEGPR